MTTFDDESLPDDLYVRQERYYLTGGSVAQVRDKSGRIIATGKREDMEVVLQAMNLFETTPGVIAKRLLWANEAEKALEQLKTKLAEVRAEIEAEAERNAANDLSAGAAWCLWLLDKIDA